MFLHGTAGRVCTKAVRILGGQVGFLQGHGGFPQGRAGYLAIRHVRLGGTLGREGRGGDENAETLPSLPLPSS